jgi:hypothetical protein
MLGRWLYRSRQFFIALLHRAGTEEIEEAQRVLGPELFAVFERMPGQYKRHAITVYRRVRDAGCADPHVWQAALLHDSGKYDPISGRYVTMAHRVLVVLLATVPPGQALLKSLARSQDSSGLRGYLLYPFYLSEHHAELGAGLASEHDAAPQVVGLIASHHKQRDRSPSLQALQAADDRS